jgi:chromosome segregation ATPase
LLCESALKAYSFHGSDPEKRFNERHSTIRMDMPTLRGYDVKQRIDALNADIASLKEDIEEYNKAIKDIRQKRDPNFAGNTIAVCRSISTYSCETVDHFRELIDYRKQTAKWIRRERAIYLWELRLRKVEALKLPMIRDRIDTLNKEACDIVVALKSHMDQVDQLLERHQQVSCEEGSLQAKLRKLSIENQQIVGTPGVPLYMRKTTQKYLQELNRVCVGAN